MDTPFYPLTFEPILQERIWGGSKLRTFLHKSIPSEKTGESWEISTLPNQVSVVSNGAFKGKTLVELIDLFPEAILGKAVLKRFGNQFPLLFKYLDAQHDLSIQLHPNDELAKERHNSFGKTEMWYVMQADENARLILGFKEDSSQHDFLKHLENKTLPSILQEVPVAKGDVFFLETGMIHAIGAGVLIAEIQQSSDITYRVYDWDRVDAEGNSRELHTDLALEAINYQRVCAQKKYQAPNNVSSTVVTSPYFTTNIIPLVGHFSLVKKRDAFRVLLCTDGFFELKVNHTVFTYQAGATILIPAILDSIQLHGNATLLEVTL